MCDSLAFKSFLALYFFQRALKTMFTHWTIHPAGQAWKFGLKTKQYNYWDLQKYETDSSSYKNICATNFKFDWDQEN